MTKAKTFSALAVSVMTVSAALAGAQTAVAQSAPTAQELTRSLNSRPPQAAAVTTPAPAVAPVSAQAPVSAPRQGAAVAPVAAPATRSVPATALTPATRMQARPAAAPASNVRGTATTPATSPVAAPAAPAPVQAPAPAPASAPRPLNAAAVATLPFRIDLKGAQIVERPAGPTAKVYSVRRGDTPLLMIYTGPQSDYPIYGGDQAEVAGRTSIIVTEGMRRRAVEHLFRRDNVQPADIHVWVMAMDGADGDLAEQIAQTVDPR